MSSTENDTTTALVLAGGGVAGIAWELGFLDGLRKGDVTLADVDLVVGTSAGAAVGAQLATGCLDEAVAAQLAPETNEIAVAVDLDAFRARLADLVAGAADATEACARIGRMAVEADTVPEDVRRAVIEARLPVHEWPDLPLRLTAVDASTGALVVFDRSSGVTLVDAVAASCAVPGIWPPTTIHGARYIDGGARSLTNADLAVGAGLVLVLVPAALVDPAQEQLDREIAVLGPDVQTVVIVADGASAAAIGPNPLDPARRRPALEAARAQAAGEVARLASILEGRVNRQPG
jgi:NTE family protein